MKKFISIFLLTMLVICCAVVAACKEGTDNTHSHIWSDSYFQDGERHYLICKDCDERLYGQHSYNNDGLCVCGKTKPITGEENPPVHSHTFDKRIAETGYLKSAATCAQKAIYYISCSCGERGTEVFEYGEFAAHTPAAAVRENEVSATCTMAGSYDEVIYCNECDEVISSVHKTIEMLDYK